MAIIRTTLLLGVLTGLLLSIGYLLGGTGGMAYALVFAGIMNFATYWFSDKIVLMMYGAQPSTDKRLNKIVEKVAEEADIPKPKVYIMNSPIANAFATGRSPKHAAVAATSGILNVLNDDELEAVFSHEIAHVKNRDTLVSAMAATIAGAISYVVNFAWYASFGNERKNSLALLPLLILAPLAAMFIQLAITRTREYGADYTGAFICKKPLALASALEKISSVAQHNPLRGNPATAHLWIVNPFSGDALVKLFSTHPPVQERIKRLKEIAKKIK